MFYIDKRKKNMGDEIDLVNGLHQQPYGVQEIDCNKLLSNQNTLGGELDLRKLNQEAVVGKSGSKTLVYTTNQNEYGPSIKIHVWVVYNFTNLSANAVERLETDVVKCIQDIMKSGKVVDVESKDHVGKFDSFIRKTSESIHSDFAMNDQLRGPYVIYSYIMHNLKKKLNVLIVSIL